VLRLRQKKIREQISALVGLVDRCKRGKGVARNPSFTPVALLLISSLTHLLVNGPTSAVILLCPLFLSGKYVSSDIYLWLD
jgi:hypothetical protein